MILLLFLPLIAFFSLFLIFFSKSTGNGIFTLIRISLLKSSLITGLFIVISTELLSYSHHITFKWLLTAWSFFAAGTVVYCIYKRVSFSGFKRSFQGIAVFIRNRPVIIIVPLILIVSAIIAIGYPPNNYDSLTYHMARVEHWINNYSVAHYQTHILRQLVFPPFAEWIILHLQLLTGTDRFANLVQTIFFSGCIIQVSLIVKSLGGNTLKQVLGSLFTAFIPMAVIQSNTTQNDIVVAYFVLSFVYYTIEMIRSYKIENIIFAGIALGLAVLTKGTAYLFCFLFCAWFLIILFSQYAQPLKKIISRGAGLSVIAVIAITLNYGHFYRNSFLTGSVLGNGSKGVSNDEHSVKAIGLVAIKNFMNHMPVTKGMKKSLSAFAINHGLDINDSKYSFNTIEWMMEGFSFDEDYAQNFLHAIFIVIGLIIFFCRKKLYDQKVNIYLLYVFTATCIAIVFCILFKWQPWSNRLETTLFMLFCPLLAFTTGSFNKIVRPVILVPFAGFAIAGLLMSAKHPVIPFGESLFSKPYKSFIYYDGFSECSKYMDTCTARSFGLYIGADMPDYVYYKMMTESETGRRPMKHMFVDNESQMYLDNFMPEIIISNEVTREKFTIGERTYLKERIFEKGPAIFRLQ